MNVVTLSVVIPTFNRAALLRRTLLALAAQSYPAAGYEVIVAVDGSTDDTTEMLRGIAVPYQLRFVWAPHAGTANARNRGLALGRGEVVISLDDDIIAAPGLLAAHATLHQGRQPVAGLGRLELWTEASLDRFARYWHRRFDEHYRKLACPGYQPAFADCLSGNLSLRRQDLLTAGGFDVRFRDYNHEDVELGYRLARQGLSFVYLREALGYHNFQKSFRQGCWDAYGDGRSSYMLARKHPAVAGQLRLTLRRHLPPAALLLRAVLVYLLPSHGAVVSLADALRPALEAILPSPLLRLYYAGVCDACYWHGVRDQAWAKDRYVQAFFARRFGLPPPAASSPGCR